MHRKRNRRTPARAAVRNDRGSEVDSAVLSLAIWLGMMVLAGTVMRMPVPAVDPAAADNSNAAELSYLM